MNVFCNRDYFEKVNFFILNIENKCTFIFVLLKHKNNFNILLLLFKALFITLTSLLRFCSTNGKLVKWVKIRNIW